MPAAQEGAGMVSVIVPTRNRATMLKRALASILGQRYPRIEIIVIANGCEDDTEQAVRDIQSQCAGQPAAQASIALHGFKETLGGARARNIGLDAARGEYVAFLDDDDIWHPDKLAKQVELLNRHDCAVVGTDYFYLYGDHHLRPAGRAAGSGVELRLADLSCENKLGGFSLCLTRKSHIGQSRIDEGLDALQDWDLWLKILRATGRPARISPFRHVYYRLDSDRISTRYPQVAGAQRRFLRAWRDTLDGPSIDYHEMRNFCFQIKARAEAGGRKQRWRALWPVIARWPWMAGVIFRSGERGLKRYVHYLLLPLVDIDAARVRIWSAGKRRAWKNPAAPAGSGV